jgi:hypothetical protein
MPPAAIIGQLRFEVQTTEVGLGRELPERLSQLFQRALSAVLADELTRLAGPGPLRRLPALTLELPPLAASRLEQDLPELLRQAVRRALADLMPEVPGAGQGTAAGSPADPLAGLRYFLRRGQLPWQLSSPSFGLDAEVERALRQHPQALLALLRQVGQQPWPRQRLARQLAPATIGQLLGLLAPADAPLVRAYLRDTLAAHRRQPLVPASEPALRQVLHELVLADLLTRWQTQFNRRAFVERQLRQLAAHYNLSFSALLRQMLAVLPAAGLPPPQAGTLPGIIQALHQQQELVPQPGSPAASAPTASAALAYYLRYGSLPLAGGFPMAREALAAEVARVLRQGRSALLTLARKVGAEAAVAGLLSLLPSSEYAGLVRLLVPGQTRPVLALLQELTGSLSAGAPRRQLWQPALALLLTVPAPAALPTLRRWLPIQAPALLAAATAGGPGREQLLHYLLAEPGTLSAPGATRLSPAQLRRELRTLLAQHPAILLDFLRQYQASRPVVRQLAALAGFGLLAQLLPGKARPGARQLATQMALAGLLGNPAGPVATGANRQLLLREAYVVFHLRLPLVGGSAHLLAQLLRAHRVPGRALLGYLRRQRRQWPVLSGNSFMRWLLVSLAEGLSPAELPGRVMAGQPLAPAGTQRRLALVAPGSLLSAVPDIAAPPSIVAERGFEPGEQAGNRLAEGAPAGVAGAGRVGEGLAYSILLGSTTATRIHTASSSASSGQRVAPTGDAGAKAPAGRALAWQLTWPATAAEGLALLAASRSASALAPRQLGPLLRWLAPREPARVATWLSARLLAAPRWPGPAALLDYALLRQLLGRARPAVRQSLATLEGLTGRELAGQRLPALLRAAVLLGHFRPGGAGAVLARLVAAYGLPGRATAARLQQLARRWPALAALPGWALLLEVLDSQHVVNGLPGMAALAARPAGSLAPAAPLADSPFLPEVNRPDWAGPSWRAGTQAARPAQTDVDLLLHYLLHGRAPWWHAGTLRPEALLPVLQQAARSPQPLREFLRQHGRAAPVQRHLAALANFSLLHELLPPPRVGRGRRQLVRPALAALDRSLRRPAGASQERLRLFLQEAYLAYAGAPQPADPLAIARQRATASGLAWRTVLAWAATLVRQHPALAADPFFGSLLHATLTQSVAQRRRRPAARGEATRPGTAQPAGSDPPLPVAAASWELIEHYLQTGTVPGGRPPTHLLAGLAPARVAGVLARARPYLSSAPARQRLVALLPAGAERHLLRQWWPASYQLLVSVAHGWLRLAKAGLTQLPDGPAGVWEAVLTVALAGGAAVPQAAALVARLLHVEKSGRPAAQRAQQLLQAVAGRLPLPGPLAALLAVRAGEAAPPRARRPLAEPATTGAAGRPATTGPALAPEVGNALTRPGSLALRPTAAEPGPAETAYVTNAGLVLLWPFLTMLFDRLGYLELRKFKTPELAERAAHLLQYLATGQEEFPEYILVLNKLLCGVEAARPLARAVLLTPEERSTGEGLLGAVIARWEALKNTSVAGLRETFLQRPGRLDYHPERVALTVETKTLDILLDQRPWAISTIKLPWMPLPLYVTWR